LRATLLLAALLLAAPAFAADAFLLEIRSAAYDAERATLKVEVGLGSRGSRTVALYDDRTDRLLAEKSTTGKDLRITVRGLQGADVPCDVRAESAGQADVSPLANAPAHCDAEPPPPPNQPPTCAITAPTADVAIDLGQSVYFAGSASDPENGPLSYEWDFGGGADLRPTVATPGNVTFDIANGSFLATFTATDDRGARCAAQRRYRRDAPNRPAAQGRGTAGAGYGRRRRRRARGAGFQRPRHALRRPGFLPLQHSAAVQRPQRGGGAQGNDRQQRPGDPG
jgi:hypothetical protein